MPNPAPPSVAPEPHRRQLLGWVGASIALTACAGPGGAGGRKSPADTVTRDSVPPTDSAGAEDTAPEACSALPAETPGPFPGDGTNGTNLLALPEAVRSDIRTSIGAHSGTAEGLPLTLQLRLVRVSAGCAPLAGYAIYVWHADRAGLYSMYTLETENYLRGVQITDADGLVTFTTIFPGCYDGRWPHIHFAIYEKLDQPPLLTSQLAFSPEDCAAAYATTGYEVSAVNLTHSTLETDMVFADGATSQVATVNTDPTTGLTATLTLGLA
jgi:protocatechuate 3,4-dioxygenase beta subunit